METKKNIIEQKKPQDNEGILFQELKNKYPNDYHFLNINPNKFLPEDWDLMDKFLKNNLTVETFREHQAKLSEWLKEKNKITIADLKVDSRANFSALIANKFVPK
jgi:hypothetical protein